MEEFIVKPQYLLDESWNDAGGNISGQVIIKLISQITDDTNQFDWNIVVLPSRDKAREYFNQNIKDKPNQKNYRCFYTRQVLLIEALEKKYSDIEKIWLAEEFNAECWCLLFQK